ncbi:HEXXH motif-containing putative peptide modification protein [Nocardia sp. CDC159]|uniref:HEXXH motif-containing putative peptide modification protein n=1 Tax=Nocardia pulmonis TaxID=2951408 RepID=A0A9X2EAH2_9NOCA|nr:MULTISPECIES: HEXXH motif-containing putative peptide modification protein [Nocardia]MCM6774508.1 HEXXH motif-containing putative peptide modification protein [Nocardia pulmonis]MCM6787426.1 HEXXH motif-containing putative peptide modification protein [Nocardia sp. CDC159]
MNDLAAAFHFPQITELHRTRIHTTCTLLKASAPSPLDLVHPALTYALTHHCLEGAEHAARQSDSQRFCWYRTALSQPPGSWFEPTPHGLIVIQAPPSNQMLRSTLSETPYYLLGPDTQPAPPELTDLVTAALDMAHQCGFGGLVGGHAPIVCLLKGKEPTDTFDSWTLSRLPGTVFLDYTTDPYLLARDIIHEAGHNWLNDALNATGAVIRDTARYFSPWKQATRPAFGFLHACWAFPLTMLFGAAVCNKSETPPATRHRLTTYLRQQRSKLRATTIDHQHALTLIEDRELRDRLREIHRAASHFDDPGRDNRQPA